VIGGGTVIGRGAAIGLGAHVRDHIRIGSRAVIGLGSVVIAAVPDDAVVAGVPARPIRSRSEGRGLVSGDADE
jgi:acetyltransferase-like isoleucine patch superfamily enzyme